MMNFEEIRNYWEGRAAGDSSEQSTTQDVFLREIELNVLVDRIKKFSPKRVADVGCGDGRTTIGLAKAIDDIQFLGLDYSSSMIENAKSVLLDRGLKNIGFDRLDIRDGLRESFNLIYTTRCLINLPSWDLQKQAIQNIHAALDSDGIYLMIENFVEGQENFNKIRKDFALPEIPVREHNLFFQRERLIDFTKDIFQVDEEVNISSAYYLVSRVIYSKICFESGCTPDYFNEHHRYAAGLPFSGEFGPVRLMVFRKNKE